MNRIHDQATALPRRTRWSKVMYDATSVDLDIEALVDLLQKQHGYTREKARSELVGRLSSATC